MSLLIADDSIMQTLTVATFILESCPAKSKMATEIPAQIRSHHETAMPNLWPSLESASPVSHLTLLNLKIKGGWERTQTFIWNLEHRHFMTQIQRETQMVTWWGGEGKGSMGRGRGTVTWTKGRIPVAVKITKECLEVPGSQHGGVSAKECL